MNPTLPDPVDGRPSDRQQHWDGVYTNKSDEEVSWFQKDPFVSLRLITAAAGRDAAIIDIGAGASRLPDRLLDEGYCDLTLLDVSEAALQRIRTRLGPRAAAIQFIVADVTRWTPGRKYMVWHDRAAFHFLIDRNDQLQYLHRLKQSLRAGGQAIIGTFALNGPERCSGLPVCRYDAGELAKLLGAEFELVETLRDAHQTPGGITQDFQFCRFVFRPDQG